MGEGVSRLEADQGGGHCNTVRYTDGCTRVVIVELVRSN